MKSGSWKRPSERRCPTPGDMSAVRVTGQADRLVSAMPSSGLSDGKEFTTKRYNSRLSLNRSVQPYLSAGGGGSSSFLRAGVALSFGDMLGDHRLQTSLQVGKTIDDFAANAAYVNMRSRWNWAILGGQVPWLTGGVSVPNTPPLDGTITREAALFRQLHRQVSGAVIYPFSNAKRFEITGGVTVHNVTIERAPRASTRS